MNASTVVPASQARCHELDAVFGERGPAAYCRCQRYKLAPGEGFSRPTQVSRPGKRRLVMRIDFT